MRLTKSVIDKLIYEGGGVSRCVYWDEISGLGLRVYPSGKKAFVLSFRAEGRKRLMVIGRYPPMTVDKARTKAMKALGQVGDGEDPLSERQTTRGARTVRVLCDLYLERYAVQKRTGDADRRRIEQHILPRWGGHRVESLRRSEIAEAHHEVGGRWPYEANRRLALLRRMLNLARHWGVVDEGWPNPAVGVPMHKEVSRDRWVDPEEMPHLAQAIDEEDSIYVRSAFWLYILTGVRKSELLRAKWSDVDLERGDLRLGTTKSGRPHVVPLSPPARAILQALPRLDGNSYLLAGANKGEHLVNLFKPWERVRRRATVRLWAAHEDPKVSQLMARLAERLGREPTPAEVRTVADFALPAGLEDVRLHDLRRTTGSWLAQAGNDLHLIGKVLNHSNAATTAIYARFKQDTIRKALNDHGLRIMAAAGKKQPAEVVELRNRKQ